MTKPGNIRNCHICKKQIKVRLIQYGRGGRRRKGRRGCYISSFADSDEGVLLGTKWLCNDCYRNFLPRRLKSKNIAPISLKKRSKGISGRVYA